MESIDWEQKYQAGEAHWDHGVPSPGLIDFLHNHPELPKGSVAIPGCGTGHDVLAWASFGFRAHGADVAPTAVRLARQQAQQAGADVVVTRADFLEHLPTEPFDYLWEHTLFCAITPDQRDAYVEAVLRWLKPAGIYLAVNYIVCDPNGPPWPVTARELWQRFMPHFNLIDQWIPRSYPNRTGKELMLWWRRA